MAPMIIFSLYDMLSCAGAVWPGNEKKIQIIFVVTCSMMISFPLDFQSADTSNEAKSGDRH